MAKKTKKRKKVAKKSVKVSKKPVKEDKNSNEIRYLERLIELSLRNVGKSEQLDSLFTNQANRLKEQVLKLKLEE